MRIFKFTLLSFILLSGDYRLFAQTPVEFDDLSALESNGKIIFFGQLLLGVLVMEFRYTVQLTA
jgi:hypothetical protein